jgi:hypothetical protein
MEHDITLQKKIMRRVYYTYALRVATMPGILQGFLMLASLIVLTYFVSLGHVIQNLMQVQVGHVGVFFYNALTNTEAWTLLLLGIIIFLAFSFRITLVFPRNPVYARM